jgi:adrenodoxin-NADP+ reductase
VVPPLAVTAPLSIAVVGSGPAGFYFVDRILKLLGDGVIVDVLDRLPTPFGLVRSGVAPDHPDTKKVINKFTSLAELPHVRFFGNVRVGTDVSVEELRNMYSGVVLAAGAPAERRLGVPGEDLAGVLSAGEFVHWYNGHPDAAAAAVPPLATVTDVGIVGAGNVALDCARLLLKPPAALAPTDVAQHALAALRSSAVSRVHIFARRGPLQAQFTGKELREVLALDNVDIHVDPETYEASEAERTAAGLARMKVCILV